MYNKVWSPVPLHCSASDLHLVCVSQSPESDMQQHGVLVHRDLEQKTHHSTKYIGNGDDALLTRVVRNFVDVQTSTEHEFFHVPATLGAESSSFNLNYRSLSQL